MDLQEMNPSQEELDTGSDIPCETKRDKNHTNTSNYLSDSLEKRIEKYKVEDKFITDTEQGHSLPTRQTPEQKKSRAFHNICLGPGAYDNLTFKDDNGQFDLKKFVINGQSKMCSKSKVLHHKSYENLLLKNSEEDRGSTKPGYEKIRRGSTPKTSTPTPSRRSSSPPQIPIKTMNSPQSNGNTTTEVDINTVNSGLVPDTPQTTVQIPADGNIQTFSADDMAVFFRCMKIDELIIQRLKRKKLDGKKFSRLRDIDLEEIGIKNPIVCYFRDRSKKQRIPFML